MIRDPEELKKKLALMREAENQHIGALLDFDNTISRFELEGTRCHNSYQVVEHSTLISDRCKDKMQEYRAEYYPQVEDMSKPEEERIDLMNTWWKLAFDAIAEEQPSEEILFQSAQQS